MTTHAFDTFTIAQAETMNLKTARGRDYYLITKSVEAAIAPDFLTDFNTITDNNGDDRFLVKDIFHMAIRYELSIKSTCYMLVEICNAPTGFYERLIDRGVSWEMFKEVQNSQDRFNHPFELRSRYEAKQ